MIRMVIAAGVLFVWYVGVSIALYGQRSDEVSADAVIVLGAAAWGNRPSPVFRERINHAIQLYEAGRVERIIFTGGVGARDMLSEAEVARRYALQRGVPDRVILLEPASTSTYENLSYARDLAQDLGLDTFLITSTPYHMLRAVSMARELGLEAYPSPTRTTRWISPVTQTSAYVREVLALTHYWLFGG